MNGKGDKWRGGWTREYEDNHNKIFKKEGKMKELIREALYKFIDYYTEDKFARVDLQIIADKFIEEHIKDISN